MKPEVIVTDNQLPSDVIRAIEKGQKIEAIKILREATGIGLANAKVLVDRASRTYGPAKPIPSAISESSAFGNLAKSLFFAVILAGFYYIFFQP